MYELTPEVQALQDLETAALEISQEMRWDLERGDLDQDDLLSEAIATAKDSFFADEVDAEALVRALQTVELTNAGEMAAQCWGDSSPRAVAAMALANRVFGKLA